MQNDDRVEFVANTYSTLGNDGLHFNQDIKNGTNNSVPSSILNALYDLSDHLPVILEIDIKQMQLGLDANFLGVDEIKINNPVLDKLVFELKNENVKNVKCTITDLSGQFILSKSFHKESKYLKGQMYLAELKSGMYLIHFDSENNMKFTKKFIKL